MTACASVSRTTWRRSSGSASISPSWPGPQSRWCWWRGPPAGRPSSSPSVRGPLDDFATRSGYAVPPVVLWGPEVGALTPTPSEVAVAYRVPLSELYRPDVPIVFRVADSEFPLLSLPLVGTQVYSPTAA